MKRITIFTPTFNRGYCLHQLYDSLTRQSSIDFHWLIIDDGSTDNTAQLCEKWQAAGLISMEYVYQANKGMIGAHSTAHSRIDTELCLCVDSDDYLVDNAIERILFLWDKHGYPEAAGLVGLDSYTDGKIVGSQFPTGILEEKFSKLIKLCKPFGDKAIVHNTKVFQQFLPYPEFDNEKFRVTSYLYLFIEQRHKLIVFNEVFIIAEYLPDGLTNNLFQQYKDSPRSFAFYRIAKMKFALSYMDRFKNAIHYVSSSLIARNKNFISETPYKLTTFMAIPFGIAFYFYLLKTKKKGVFKPKLK